MQLRRYTSLQRTFHAPAAAAGAPALTRKVELYALLEADGGGGGGGAGGAEGGGARGEGEGGGGRGGSGSGGGAVLEVAVAGEAEDYMADLADELAAALLPCGAPRPSRLLQLLGYLENPRAFSKLLRRDFADRVPSVFLPPDARREPPPPPLPLPPPPPQQQQQEAAMVLGSGRGGMGLAPLGSGGSKAPASREPLAPPLPPPPLPPPAPPAAASAGSAGAASMGLQPLATSVAPVPANPARLAEDFLSSMGAPPPPNGEAVGGGGCGGAGVGGGGGAGSGGLGGAVGGEMAPSMGLAPLSGAPPTFTEAELLDYPSDAAAEQEEEQEEQEEVETSSKKRKARHEAAPKAAPKATPTAAAAAAAAAAARGSSLDAVLADALGLSGGKRAAPDDETVNASGAAAACWPPAKVSRQNEVRVAWLLEGRAAANAAATAAHRGAAPPPRVQEALRAVATSLGLTEVSITDVSET